MPLHPGMVTQPDVTNDVPALPAALGATRGSLDAFGESALPVVGMARGLLEALPQAIRVIGRMPDEDPLDDLLGGHWVLPEDGEDDGAVQILITEAAQVRCSHCTVVSQQPQDLIPGQRGVLRRLLGVPFI
jgi:hypothetical protein